MSAKRHAGFVAIVLSITMVCAVLLTSFVPSDSLHKTYICYEEKTDDSGISEAQNSVSLVPKPIKEASFADESYAVGWLKSEKLSSPQLCTGISVAPGSVETYAIQALLSLCYTKLLCRLLI